jgi:cyanate permease
MSGVFLFIGPLCVGKWGVKKSYLIATALLTLGNLICVFSKLVVVFILGRVIAGIGFGITGALVAATVFMWFPAKERPMVFTVNALGCMLIQAIAYNVTVPIYESSGRWQTVFIVCAGLSALAFILWVSLGRELGVEDKEAKGKTNIFEGLRLAFSSKQLWFLAIPVTCGTFVTYSIGFYYPTFLSQVRGFNAATASSITSVTFIAGAIGSLMGGIVTTAVGRRKPLIVGGIAITLATVIGLFTLTQTAVLILIMACNGCFRSLSAPVASTASTEVDNMSPAMAAGANSMLFGFGSLLTFFISPLIGALQNIIGLSNALLFLCCGLIAAGLIVSFWIRETGPKAKKKQTN